MRMQYYLYDSPVFSRFPSWVCWLLLFSEQLSRSHDSPQSDLGIYTDHLLLSKIVGWYHCLNYSTNKRIRQDLLFKWKIKIYNPFRFAKNAGNLCYICNWKEVRSIKNELIYWGTNEVMNPCLTTSKFIRSEGWKLKVTCIFVSFNQSLSEHWFKWNGCYRNYFWSRHFVECCSFARSMCRVFVITCLPSLELFPGMNKFGCSQFYVYRTRQFLFHWF